MTRRESRVNVGAHRTPDTHDKRVRDRGDLLALDSQLASHRLDNVGGTRGRDKPLGGDTQVGHLAWGGCGAGRHDVSEQPGGGVVQAAHGVVVEHDAPDPPVLGQHPGLGPDRLRREHPVHW